MRRASDGSEASRRQRARSGSDHGVGAGSAAAPPGQQQVVMSLSGQQQAVTVAGLLPAQSPVALPSGQQLQQNPLHHFIMTATGQVQSIQSVTNAATLQQQVTLPASHRSQHLLTGMMVVPPLSPRGYQSQQSAAALLTPTSTVSSGGLTSGGPANTALLMTAAELTGRSELQMASPGGRSPLAFTPVSTVSASGGTIHHLGQSPPPRAVGVGPGVVIPTVSPTLSAGGLNPSQQQIFSAMNVQQIQQALQQQQQAAAISSSSSSTSPRRSSTGHSSPSASPRSAIIPSSPIIYTPLTPQNTNRTSPVQSPERPRKRIKLEEKPAPTQEIATYRKLICDEKMRLLTEIKENYNEHLTELFFLQNGGNIMDYYTWKRRPTMPLLQFLQASNLDSDLDEVGQEMKINDEVKVITTSGGTVPLATPVAISTTLPPAVSAIQQGHTEPGKKLGGRHGMVFGHVHPTTPTTQQPQLPGETSGGEVECEVSQPPPSHEPAATVAIAAESSCSSISSSSVVMQAASAGGVPLVASPGPSTPIISTVSPTFNTPVVITSFAGSQPTSIAITTTTSTTLSVSSSALSQPSTTVSSVTSSSAATTPVVSTPALFSPELVKAVSMDTATTTSVPKTTTAATTATTSVTTSSTSPKAVLKAPIPASRLGTRQNAISTITLGGHALGSQEAIVERAKQEAQVIQRVAEMRKEGLWSSRRLPKVQEPPRNKAHWDYLLEEMTWLAADFTQERKWKKAGARKIARMISRYHADLQQKEQRAEKEEAQKLKRIASNLAKMVKEFWNNIEKVVEYKQQSRLEEKRKKALDLHLSFIVDQTEKYSSWLTEGLAGNSGTPSVTSSVPTSPRAVEDGDFEPDHDESDNEETIDQAEAEMEGEDNDSELEALRLESEMPIEDLLKTLPPAVLEKPASIHSSEDEDVDSEPKVKRKRMHDGDEDFQASDEDETDIEETIDEQEKQESVDHAAEIKDLEDEGEMDIEELRKKYAGAYDSDFEAELSQTETEDDTEDGDSDDEEEEEENEEEEKIEDDKEEEEIGVDYLLKNEKELDRPETTEVKQESEKEQELNKWAAAAQSLQPTGYTLETTKICTTVPFLLKHTLREYQHVGLDWLATMHDRKLNGILADEMGLGKTIQTIAVLAHLACERGVWGPHLVVVPTSVMLNWEMEFKKWSPAFKILTYYGNQKERKAKRQGWTKTNAFHVCITSYKLVIQDHQAFRRKKWRYFILDEAQNIKNFKSQRWQMLLNFSSQRRLLLTGTPLQNSLMELWSLMHFLMPHVFTSHRDFKEWFSNPLTGMIEGSREYNESIIRRLHKVLRPFLLRRLKQDVEKQMPKKYEHVVMCHLSKRQRFLYEDFMSQTKTKETLATGHFMSVINILMQLRKVCNHPNLFDPRPIVSPFQMEGITYTTASIVLRALEKDPIHEISVTDLQPSFGDLELILPAFAAHRVKKLQTPRPLIEEIDSMPDPPARPKPLDKKRELVFRTPSPAPQPVSGRSSPVPRASSPFISSTTPSPCPASAQDGTKPQPPQARVAPQQQIDVVSNVSAASTSSSAAAAAAASNGQQAPITVQIHHTEQGTRLMIPSGQLSQLHAGYIQIVQTPTGQKIITNPAANQPAQASQAAPAQPVLNGPELVATGSAQTDPTSLSSTSVDASGKPIGRVAPFTQENNEIVMTSQSPISTIKQQILKTSSVAHRVPTPVNNTNSLHESPSAKILLPSKTRAQAADKKMQEKSALYMSSLAEKRAKRRQEKLTRLARMNKRHCDVRPIYGQDLCDTVNILSAVNAPSDCDTAGNSASARVPSLPHWHGAGYVHCEMVRHCSNPDHPSVYWRQTEALKNIVHTPEQYLEELRDILVRYVFAIPTVTAPCIKMHASHPPPSYLNMERMRERILHQELSPKAAYLHPISTRTAVHFPEARLIQYDCGKLQTLDILLRRLKTDHHRVLIFTQMTRMLDILEAFLNYHGHRYLRLDGTTRVEQRQALMERFNMDKRIFVFILSTRSGGIGVNLTGADTVIFYDSDWNPTMDAQAQDRCHRIGQTRDVHIYRLVSEKTVEENILKKANQKRLLGNVAIEGGNFTMAYFKENTIQELFEEPSGLEAMAKEQEAAEAAKVKAADKETKPVVKTEPEVDTKVKVEVVETKPKVQPDVKVVKPEKDLTQEQMEMALAQAEDETDVQAVKVVKAEQKAELAEFDESIPWDEREAELRREHDEEVSKVEQELRMLEKELTPVERYAVGYLEEQSKDVACEELEKAEEEVSLAKEEWELSRLKAVREEEERRAELEEDEMLFTYTRDDAYNQVKNKKKKRAAQRAAAAIQHSSLMFEGEGGKAHQRANRRSSVGSSISTVSGDDKSLNNSPEEVKKPAKSRAEKRKEARAKAKRESLAGGEPSQKENDIDTPPAKICAPRASGDSVVAIDQRKTICLSIPKLDLLSPVRMVGDKPMKPNNKNKRSPKKSGPKSSTPKVAPKENKKSTPNQPIPKLDLTNSGSPPQPWSNPNLVIRTRRASAKEALKSDDEEATVVATAASLATSQNVSLTASPSASGVIGNPGIMSSDVLPLSTSMGTIFVSSDGIPQTYIQTGGGALQQSPKGPARSVLQVPQIIRTSNSLQVVRSGEVAGSSAPQVMRSHPTSLQLNQGNLVVGSSGAVQIPGTSQTVLTTSAGGRTILSVPLSACRPQGQTNPVGVPITVSRSALRNVSMPVFANRLGVIQNRVSVLAGSPVRPAQSVMTRPGQAIVRSAGPVQGAVVGQPGVRTVVARPGGVQNQSVLMTGVGGTTVSPGVRRVTPSQSAAAQRLHNTIPILEKIAASSHRSQKPVPILEKMAMQFALVSSPQHVVVPATATSVMAQPGTAQVVMPGSQVIPSQQSLSKMMVQAPSVVGQSLSQMVVPPSQVPQPASQVVVEVSSPVQQTVTPRIPSTVSSNRQTVAQLVAVPSSQVPQPATQVVVEAASPIQTVAQRAPAVTLSSNRQTVAQLVSGKPRTTQYITRPMLAQLVPGKGGVTQLIQTRPGGQTYAQVIQSAPAGAANPRPLTQVLQAPQTITQLVRQGGQTFAQIIPNKQGGYTQVVPAKPGTQFAQVIQNRDGTYTQVIPNKQGTLTQVIQTAAGKQTLAQMLPARQQYMVVSTPDQSNTRNRVVILQQQPGAALQARAQATVTSPPSAVIPAQVTSNGTANATEIRDTG